MCQSGGRNAQAMVVKFQGDTVPGLPFRYAFYFMATNGNRGLGIRISDGRMLIAGIHMGRCGIEREAGDFAQRTFGLRKEF